MGFQHKHSGMMEAFKSVVSQHGPLALWRGASAAMARVTCGSASQLATFSKTKNFIENLQVLTTKIILILVLKTFIMNYFI